MSLHFAGRKPWRAWLKQHHGSERAIWLRFYKKLAARPTVTYDDAVEEALCFGWIDSTIRRVDDQCYIRRFSPRRKNSVWSDINLSRMKKMIAAKKVNAAGFAVYDEHAPTYKSKLRNLLPIPIPNDLKTALTKNLDAKANFEKLTEKYTQMCLRWITFAKRPETRAKRIAEFVELTSKNKRIGMK